MLKASEEVIVNNKLRVDIRRVTMRDLVELENKELRLHTVEWAQYMLDTFVESVYDANNDEATIAFSDMESELAFGIAWQVWKVIYPKVPDFVQASLSTIGSASDIT